MHPNLICERLLAEAKGDATSSKRGTNFGQ